MGVGWIYARAEGWVIGILIEAVRVISIKAVVGCLAEDCRGNEATRCVYCSLNSKRVS